MFGITDELLKYVDTPSVPSPYDMVSAFTGFEKEERKRMARMMLAIIPNTFLTMVG